MSNDPKNLLATIRSSEIEKDVVDATFEGLPVKVLVAKHSLFTNNDLIPLAILMTDDVLNRTTPPEGHRNETKEEEQIRETYAHLMEAFGLGGDAA